MTLVKPKDLAQTLNVSIDTIYRMAQRGDIPVALKVGPRLRFDETAVVEHLERLKAQR